MNKKEPIMKYMFGLRREQWEIIEKETEDVAFSLIIKKIIDRMDYLNDNDPSKNKETSEPA